MAAHRRGGGYGSGHVQLLRGARGRGVLSDEGRHGVRVGQAAVHEPNFVARMARDGEPDGPRDSTRCRSSSTVRTTKGWSSGRICDSGATAVSTRHWRSRTVGVTFAEEAVRDHLGAIARELVLDYPSDGLELDFAIANGNRPSYLRPEDVERYTPVITDWVAGSGRDGAEPRGWWDDRRESVSGGGIEPAPRVWTCGHGSMKGSSTSWCR